MRRVDCGMRMAQGARARSRRRPLCRLSSVSSAQEATQAPFKPLDTEAKASRWSLESPWLRPPTPDTGLAGEAAMLRAQSELLSHFVQSDRPLFPKRIAVPRQGHDGVHDVINCVDSWDGLGPAPCGDTVVLAHGFGMGLGVFMRNYGPLLERYNRVVGVDWLGMGGSSRPPPEVAPRLPASPGKAVNFFVHSLECWRQRMGICNLHLVGHSLGGYLAAQYAMQYPGNIRSLVLASPAGVLPFPEGAFPQDWTNVGVLPRLMNLAWHCNMTPQQLVRFLGPAGGRRLVDAYVAARLKNSAGACASPLGKELLTRYLYLISTMGPASGEYAMNSILVPLVTRCENQDAPPGPFGIVKTRLSDRTKKVKVYAREPLADGFSKALRGESFPVGLVYGDRDWLNDPKIPRIVERWRADGMHVTASEVGNAGHHLYLDNAEGFGQEIASIIEMAKR